MTERTVAKLSKGLVKTEDSEDSDLFCESDSDSISLTSTIAVQPVDEENQIWIVDKILAEQADNEGKVYYLAQWEGYSIWESTWEPRESFNEDITLSNWATIKAKIRDGLEPALDIDKWHVEAAAWEKEKADRHKRRERKRRQLRLRRLGLASRDSEVKVSSTSKSHKRRGSSSSSSPDVPLIKRRRTDDRRKADISITQHERIPIQRPTGTTLKGFMSGPSDPIPKRSQPMATPQTTSLYTHASSIRKAELKTRNRYDKLPGTGPLFVPGEIPLRTSTEDASADMSPLSISPLSIITNIPPVQRPRPLSNSRQLSSDTRRSSSTLPTHDSSKDDYSPRLCSASTLSKMPGDISAIASSWPTLTGANNIPLPNSHAAPTTPQNAGQRSTCFFWAMNLDRGGCKRSGDCRWTHYWTQEVAPPKSIGTLSEWTTRRLECVNAWLTDNPGEQPPPHVMNGASHRLPRKRSNTSTAIDYKHTNIANDYKQITCFFWGSKDYPGGCTNSESTCKFAHERTGRIQIRGTKTSEPDPDCRALNYKGADDRNPNHRRADYRNPDCRSEPKEAETMTTIGASLTDGTPNTADPSTANPVITAPIAVTKPIYARFQDTIIDLKLTNYTLHRDINISGVLHFSHQVLRSDFLAHTRK